MKNQLMTALLGIGLVATAHAGLPDASKLHALKQGLQKQLDAFQPIRNNTGHCVALPVDDVKKSGAQGIVEKCEGKANQRWNIANGMISNPGKLCLQPVAAKDQPTLVQGITCIEGEENGKERDRSPQTWTVEGDLAKGARLKYQDQCLSTENGDVNARLLLQGCDDKNPNQIWKQEMPAS